MPEHTADFSWLQYILLKEKSTAISNAGTASVSIQRTVSVVLSVLVLMFSSLIWSAPLAAQEESITFKHFGQLLTLQPGLSEYQLTYAGQQIKVKLSNKLIVKAKTSLTAAAIQAVHPAIEQVQQLAVLSNSVLWLVQLEPNAHLPELLQLLTQQSAVFYAQPDLQQSRMSASVYKNMVPITTVQSKQMMPLKKVKVAVIDDGFDFNIPILSNFKLILQYDADLRLADASPKLPADQHGSKVLQLLMQAAAQRLDPPLQAELIAIRQVSSKTSDMVLAFSVARRMQAHIVNSSWLIAFMPEPLFDLLDDWSAQSQPYLVFAAGNRQQDACLDNAFSRLHTAILVAATQQDGKLTNYSNHGSCIDLKMTGQFQLQSDTKSGKIFSGTSAAAAFVSGRVVYFLSLGQRPDLEQLQLDLVKAHQKAEK